MALISTATMAGSNVNAEQMRHDFSSIDDVVVHTSREAGPDGRRQVAEIVAVPAMQATENDVTVEPIFTRSSADAPLVWTGAPVPEELATRIDRAVRHRGFQVEDVLDGRVSLL